MCVKKREVELSPVQNVGLIFIICEIQVERGEEGFGSVVMCPHCNTESRILNVRQAAVLVWRNKF